MKDVFNVRPVIKNEIQNIIDVLNKTYFGQPTEYDPEYARWVTKPIFRHLYLKFDVFRDEDKKYYEIIIDNYIRKFYDIGFEEKEEQKTIDTLVALTNLIAWERELRGEYNPYTKYKYLWLNSPTTNE